MDKKGDIKILSLEQLKEQVFYKELNRIENGIQNSISGHNLNCGNQTEYNHYVYNDELGQKVTKILLSSGYELLKGDNDKNDKTICIKL